MINHYRTLGVSPDAEEVVIRSAYLALIRRYHPDTGAAEADPKRAQAITAAWEVLRDPERRAAYDEARRARFQPEMSGGVIVVGGPKVRGGAAARNVFLLLAAATVGLGWWALQQPLGTTGAQPTGVQPPRTVAAAPAVPLAEAAPEPRNRPSEPRQEVAELPPLPPAPEEPVADEVVLPPLPAVDTPRMPVKMAEVRMADRRVTAPSPRTFPPAPKPAPRKVVASAAPAPAPKSASAVDLAPLERHLQLLTDQSYQFADAGRRSRLFSTRETFLSRLKNCPDDPCKRDAYLRRNQEVAEIMRK